MRANPGVVLGTSLILSGIYTEHIYQSFEYCSNLEIILRRGSGIGTIISPNTRHTGIYMWRMGRVGDLEGLDVGQRNSGVNYDSPSRGIACVTWRYYYNHAG